MMSNRVGRFVVLFGQASVAAAIMTRVSPVDNGVAAYLLWSLLFVTLLTSRGTCASVPRS